MAEKRDRNGEEKTQKREKNTERKETQGGKGT